VIDDDTAVQIIMLVFCWYCAGEI